MALKYLLIKWQTLDAMNIFGLKIKNKSLDNFMEEKSINKSYLTGQYLGLGNPHVMYG